MFGNKNNITLSIPKPCHENWQEMTPSQKGRFCASCQKNVIDFTLASDREIINKLKENKSICGRFNADQLNREIIIPKEKSSIWMATASAIISFLGLGTYESHAQERVKIEQTDKKVITDSITKIKNKKLEITGIITYNSDPLPGVNVRIIGTNTLVQTDLNGNFSIQVKRNATLEFSFIGMKSKKIKIKDSKKIILQLKDDDNIKLGEVMITE